MVTFAFREYGENLGTRQLGAVARERLLQLLQQDELPDAYRALPSAEELKKLL